MARPAHRVAGIATLLVLLGYVLVCLVVDLAAHERALSSVDARLRTRLAALSSSLGALRPSGTALIPVGDGDGDVDDAPVLAWWIPAHAKVAVALTTSTPPLPRSDWAVREITTRAIGGEALRVDGRALGNGSLVDATSTRGDERLLDALWIAEGVVAPLLGAAVYLAALAVGRSAAGPVERARQRQLAFAADASHELRTPLSVIEAEVGLALSSPRAAPAYKAALERVGAESRRLRDIVEDLLFLARFDAEPRAEQPGRVPLAAIAERGAERFAAIAAAKRQTLRWSTEGSSEADSPTVEVDALWLERLASVLLDNACRVTPEGGVVEIRVRSDGQRCALIVDDSGPGIPEELRAEIFERFRRGDAAPSAYGQASGAGLGLSIADAIVRSSGGTFSVGDSVLGGASMQVSWPLSRSPKDRAASRGR